ncbi:MAG: hypothetical protein AAGJ46_07520 [Planctomycetota bacterium]
MQNAIAAVPSRFALLALAVAVGPGTDAKAQAEGPDLSGEQFLLLDNGSVLRGQVQLEGDRVRVSSRGRVLYVPARRVQRQAAGLAPLYEWQRDQLKPADLNGRLRLADWCLKNKLWPQASCELLTAKAAGAEADRLSSLERRLVAAYQREQDGQRATAEALLQERQQAEAAEAARQLAMIRALPEGALVEFTRRIQPILVNSCTTSGCHQAGGTESFQLNRNWIHGTANRRSTLANLATVLAAIDRQRPDSSPLIVAMNEAHAGMPQALAATRADLSTRVRDWAYQVAAASGTPSSPATRRRLGPAVSPSYGGLIAGGFSGGAPVQRGQSFNQNAFGRGTASIGGEAPPGTGAVTTAAALLPPSRSRTYYDPEFAPASFEQEGAAATRERASEALPTARDEFDPAEFNRRRSAANPQSGPSANDAATP